MIPWLFLCVLDAFFQLHRLSFLHTGLLYSRQMRLRNFARSCVACPQDSVRILKSFSEALRVSSTTLRALSFLKISIDCLWYRSSGILEIVQASNDYVRSCTPALFRTSVSGILSCHLILRVFSGNLSGNG